MYCYRYDLMPKGDHKNQTEAFQNKNEYNLDKVIVFNRHICAINTAKYKDSSSFAVFCDIDYQTYPTWASRTSNITTRLHCHCYLKMAAAFYKQTNKGARCSSVVRAFAHGAMGRRVDPSWWTHRAISRSRQCSTTGVTNAV